MNMLSERAFDMLQVHCPSCDRRLFDITPLLAVKAVKHSQRTGRHADMELKCYECGDLIDFRFPRKSNTLFDLDPILFSKTAKYQDYKAQTNHIIG